jgi:two-component sensor histidine kinase
MSGSLGCAPSVRNRTKAIVSGEPVSSVDIGWSQDGDTFTITWAEQGGPAVAEPEATGFGTFALRSMTEQALNAVVSLEHASSGMKWQLTTSLKNVVDDPLDRPAR